MFNPTEEIVAQALAKSYGATKEDWENGDEGQKAFCRRIAKDFMVAKGALSSLSFDNDFNPWS